MNENIIGYCVYCHEAIYEDEQWIETEEGLFHCDENNPLNNCYFVLDAEEEDIG